MNKELELLKACEEAQAVLNLIERCIMKHTPGPWSYNGYYIKSDEDTVIAQVFNGLFAHKKANANLIAAAPELLEACEMALQELRLLPKLHPKLQIKLQQVISKAKGE